MIVRYIKKLKNFLLNCFLYRSCTPNDFPKYVLTKDIPFVEMRDDLELARMVKKGMIKLDDLKAIAQVIQTLNTPPNRSCYEKTPI